MRFTLALLALATAFSGASAHAWKRQSLPTCAESCIGSATVGSCSASDEQCLCSSSAFVDSVESCIEKSCSAGDIQSSLQAAEAVCAQAGVTLSLTGSLSATASASGSGPASASATSGSANSTSSSTSAPATTSTKSGASLVAVNGFMGLAAVGAAMFAAL